MFEGMETIVLRTDHYVLDGVHNGIAAWIISESRYICGRKGSKLFTNYQILESTLLSKGYSKLNYEIRFILDDSKYEFPMNDMYYNPENKCWEAGIYDQGNNLRWDIEIAESHIDKVVNIGYFTTNKSFIKANNKKEAINKNKEIQEIFQSCSSILATYPYYGIYIDKDECGNFCVNLAGCTGKIHICINDKLIDFNKNRLSKNLRVLPFDKNMDKLGTLYVYTTMDDNERDEIKSRLISMVDTIANYTNQCFSELEPKFNPTEFKGYILLNREEE